MNDEQIHCEWCGYNLTGCYSLRCPECGNPFNRDVLLGTIPDERIRCPACLYNLSGHAEPRCPGCGRPFDRSEMLQRVNWTAADAAGRTPPLFALGPESPSAAAIWPEDLGDGPARLRPLKHRPRHA